MPNSTCQENLPTACHSRPLPVAPQTIDERRRLVRATEKGPAFRVLAAPDTLGLAGLDLGPTGLVEGNAKRLRARRRSAFIRRLGTANR